MIGVEFALMLVITQILILPLCWMSSFGEEISVLVFIPWQPLRGPAELLSRLAEAERRAVVPRNLDDGDRS